MKRINILLSIAAFLFAMPRIASAQSADVWCTAHEERQKLIKEHPEVLQFEAALEERTKEFVKNFQAQAKNGARDIDYTIPIVFHILNHGGIEFLSDAQIIDQVNILNRDYHLMNADTSIIVPKFQPLKAYIGITFKLAQIDPWGNCTNGIDKIYTYQTETADDDSKLHYWPREKYLNVWVSHSIGQAGAAGYAFYPSAWPNVVNGHSPDGVLILDNYIGSIGTGQPGYSRALTHEIGHFLNLEHPWGNNNNPDVACGDDGVADTPPTAGHSLRCPLYDSTSTGNSPGGGPLVCQHDTLENVQNYMDYSYCSTMFTLGQKARMLAALTDTISNRNNLWSAANLQATGTDGSFHSPCAPIAGFGVNTNFVCQGSPVTFGDLSYNGDVTSRNWSFPNGDITTSSDSAPVVTFQTTGWQRVTLTVTNSYGSSTKSDSIFVYVADNSNIIPAPYLEDFEDGNEYSQNWTTLNGEENAVYFARTTNTSAVYGNASMICNNYNSVVNHDIDELISPPIDLTGLANTALKLTFRYTLADPAIPSSTSYPKDSFVVYASKDCGVIWKYLSVFGGQNMINAATSNYYVPTKDQFQWKKGTATIPAAYKLGNVRFKFRFYSSAAGNNFYLDNINIGNAQVGISEPALGFDELSIFPNPTMGSTTLAINNTKEQPVTIKLMDITGKEISEVFNANLPEGKSEFTINSNNKLSAGMYFLKINATGNTYSKKLVIE